MSNMHTETYNAFKQANVPDEQAQKAAIAIAGDQNIIMDKLNKISEDIHSLDKKFMVLATIMATALPIIGLLIGFVLKEMN